MLQKYGASACIPAGAFSAAKIVTFQLFHVKNRGFVCYLDKSQGGSGNRTQYLRIVSPWAEPLGYSSSRIEPCRGSLCFKNMERLRAFLQWPAPLPK